MAAPVTIFSGTTGLNNTADQVRLDFNLETGIVDLSEAVNVRIDNTGRPGRRDGFTLRHGGNFHSLFTRGNTGYVGLDDGVYRINPDLSLTGVRFRGWQAGFCVDSGRGGTQRIPGPNRRREFMTRASTLTGPFSYCVSKELSVASVYRCARGTRGQ